MMPFGNKLLSVIVLLTLIMIISCGCSDNTDTTSADSSDADGNGILVKAEKYAYRGTDVMIMHVDNRSDKNYILTIEGHFFDADGNEIKTRTEKFAGFPAGYQNYFVLQPGVCFDSFSYEITTEIYKYKTLAEHLKLPTEIEFFTAPAWLNGSDIVPEDIEFDKSKSYVSLWAHLYPYVSTYEDPLNISGYFIMFNSKGEILLLEYFHDQAVSSSGNNTGPVFQCYVSDVPMEYIEYFEVPSDIKNSTGVFALTWVDTFDN